MPLAFPSELRLEECATVVSDNHIQRKCSMNVERAGTDQAGVTRGHIIA